MKVIIPRYKCIPWEYQTKMVYRGSFYMDLCADGRSFYVGIMEYVWDGVVYDFIDNEDFFSAGNPYTNLIDDIPKYCYFAKAALAALNYMDFAAAYSAGSASGASSLPAAVGFAEITSSVSAAAFFMSKEFSSGSFSAVASISFGSTASIPPIISFAALSFAGWSLYSAAFVPIAIFRIRDKKGGEGKLCRARRRTQAG